VPARKRPQSKKKRKVEAEGFGFIKASFNNTIITLTDANGNVISWSSGGRVGYKGTRKSTAFVAQLAARDCAKEAMDMGLRQVEVSVRGPGPGREAAIRSLQAAGLKVTSIRDITPTPHNGCRPPKKRRV
jgi:small subunit ribosomal protein S11